MKKLSLSLENLEVESFQTSPEQSRPGTVIGQATMLDGNCNYEGEAAAGTYQGVSCASTCLQAICTCTAGVTACARTCVSCPGDCATNEGDCVTQAAYPGC